MKIIRSISEMQSLALRQRESGRRIGLVPTMGSLHEGHLCLVDAAKQRTDFVVLSLFVNPTQFGPQEDFSRYPRDFERDRRLAEERGVDVLFAPEAAEVYPPGHQTFVVVTELSRGLCGAFRPGHFRGVATVVAALFMMTQPQLAVFGEKDYQQLAVIRRMVRDLHIPVSILGLSTLRDADGLALSSRNAYLSAEERAEALGIPRAIAAAQERFHQGERRAAVLIETAASILAQGKSTVLQYLEMVDAETLESVESIARPARLMTAVLVNGKRLIDNGEFRV
ncbi:MAG TPA: pantoate--beta-alanine ligase [Deltaproteobacteria bacterium]|nr:pantoate--beta-alanine ligase [Deltaproteobacteria bacterium]